MEKLKVLDLFSGGGGFTLGLDRTGGFETVAFCEIERFPQKVLTKNWPEVPIYEDVKKLTAANGPEAVDLICGGYPCQPFSTAGQRKGKEDDRHLWPEVSRLLDEYRPRWGLFENVAGHVSMGLDDVLSDLESKDYTTRAFIIPACALNAPHRRDRVWIVANSRNERVFKRGVYEGAKGKDKQSSGVGRNDIQRGTEGTILADSECERRQRQGRAKGRLCSEAQENWEAGLPITNGGWRSEPQLGRVANGIPDRAHRLKLLGNAVVPQIPELIGHAILEAERRAA